MGTVLLGKFTMDALLGAFEVAGRGAGKVELGYVCGRMRGDEWVKSMASSEGCLREVAVLLDELEWKEAQGVRWVTRGQFVFLLERSSGATYSRDGGLVKKKEAGSAATNPPPAAAAAPAQDALAATVNPVTAARDRLEASFAGFAARLAVLSSDYASASGVEVRATPSSPKAGALASPASSALKPRQAWHVALRFLDEEIMRSGEQVRQARASVANNNAKNEALMEKLELRMAGAHIGEGEEEAARKRERVAARKTMLSGDQKREVFAKYFAGGSASEVLADHFKIPLTREKIGCLREGVWLNDEVINLYMQLLLNRDRHLCQENPSRRHSHFFNSFFLEKLLEGGSYNFAGVKRWTKKANIEDVFELEKIFFPVNTSQTHWCMAVVYIQRKRIQYYDSMGGQGYKYTRALLCWLHDEHKAKKGGRDFDDSDWEVLPPPDDTPQQANGIDCGVFACMFASYLSEDLPLDFGQAEMSEIRTKLAWQLVHALLE